MNAMTDLSQSTRQFPKVDGAFAAIIVIYVCVALFLPAEFGATLGFTANAMTSTAPFIIFAVLAVAYLKATGAETLLAPCV
jgi:hypothetical protein